MKIYYIYHLKGKKIGCTQNPKRRTKKQGFDNYEILEQHTDIYIASDRELELQREWGYKVDTKPYWKSIKMATFESRSKGGKIGGKVVAIINAATGHMDKMRKARKRRQVIQMDILGNQIQKFESVKMASDASGVSQSNISNCCQRKRKTTGGYSFRYA